MKKLLLSLAVIALASSVVLAQTKVVEDKKVTKRTSTVPQKVHNTFSKNKKYSGKKTKHVKTVETKTPAQ